MEIVKDLTSTLDALEKKDRFYTVQATIKRLLAPQSASRPFEYKKKGWGEIERVETLTDGTPTATRAPRRIRKNRKGDEEIKRSDCWTFKMRGTKILLPWGGSFGLLKGGLKRCLDAQKKLRYDSVLLDLIRVYPSILAIDGKPDSTIDGMTPEVVLETRHTNRGDVRVEVFFDYLTDRKINFTMEVDSECPLNEEKFVSLLKSLNTLDNFGPSKRGAIQIDGIAEVKLTSEEVSKLNN